ncbi:MAG: hypothetical protein PHQ40_00840 [Anaerolineaceae bacterium]|nr:hypothetical protein [Anaerolineaceae bacterium]
MGKNNGDEENRTTKYTPSLWLTVNAFTRDGAEILPQRLTA